MRLAIISDVHGNYPALAAVIGNAEKNNVDGFIFAGDYIFDLPYSNEVTELIRSLENASVIGGNKEGYLEWLVKEDQNGWDSEQMGAVYQTFRELKKENLAYLLSLEKGCFVGLPYHGTLYAAHFVDALHGGQKKTACSSSKFKEEMEKSPFSHGRFLTYIGSFLNEKNTRDALSDIDASVFVFGHSHLQWHGYCGGRLIINPGSCGQPLDYNTDAAYTILEDCESGIVVYEKRVPYDVEAAIRQAENTEVCKKGEIWSKLVFSALRTGRDEFCEFFRLAERISNGKTGSFYDNETWRTAGKLFF